MFQTSISIVISLLALVFTMKTSWSQMTNGGNMQMHLGSEIGLYGDFTNNGTFLNNVGDFHLVNVGLNTLDGSNMFQVENLIKNSPDTTHLNQVFRITNSLTFTNGMLRSDRDNSESKFFEFWNNASYTGASNERYIDGVVRKRGNEAFSFPVGQDGDLQMATIGAPASATDHFTAFYRHDIGHIYGYPHWRNEDGIEQVSTCEFWIINRTGGSSAVPVTLNYDINSCGVTAICSLLVVRWDGGKGSGNWTSEGNGGAPGTPSAGTVTTGSGFSVCGTPSAVAEFSPFTFGSTTRANPLPIELLDFHGEFTDNKVVDLYWTTNVEINNSHFIIEKSYDGFKWEFLERIEGAGNSSQIIDYLTHDRQLKDGLQYYKLTQVDFDGESKSYPPHSVMVNSDLSELYSFPNPTSGNLSIHGSPEEIKNFKLYDGLGRYIQLEPLTVSTTDNSIQLDIRSLAKGIYHGWGVESKIKIIKR
ncbi:MAG: hypothetical protein ACI9G9_001224 [Psychromonas sp.]|jgi:hypothetical protein